MNKEATLKYITDNYESWFVAGLADFVRIPNLTIMVDQEYQTNGLV